MRRRTLLMLVLSIGIWLAGPVLAGDYRIVPGQRIGSVVLGMSRQAVHQMLHAPQVTCRLSGRIVEDSWRCRLSKPQQHRYNDVGLYWKFYFVNVYFKQGRVAQIEVNSPQFHTRNGLSTNSPATAFEKRYRPFHSSYDRDDIHLEYEGRDASGASEEKHFETLEDSIHAGIAWRYGSWGDLAPEPDPLHLEVVIVHAHRQPIIRQSDTD